MMAGSAATACTIRVRLAAIACMTTLSCNCCHLLSCNCMHDIGRAGGSGAPAGPRGSGAAPQCAGGTGESMAGAGCEPGAPGTHLIKDAIGFRIQDVCFGTQLEDTSFRDAICFRKYLSPASRPHERARRTETRRRGMRGGRRRRPVRLQCAGRQRRQRSMMRGRSGGRPMPRLAQFGTTQCPHRLRHRRRPLREKHALSQEACSKLLKGLHSNRTSNKTRAWAATI
jgi:hypothetical protein